MKHHHVSSRERFIFACNDVLVERTLSRRGEALLEQVLAAGPHHPLAPQVSCCKSRRLQL